MSFYQTLLLGTISGLTIFLGLPLARLKPTAKNYIGFLNALAIGILFFLFFDVMENAASPVEEAIKQPSASLWVLLIALLGGFGVGFLSLVYYGKRYLEKGGVPPQQLAFLIAIGIGLHNFSEGLAIGNSAHTGELQLALLLIIGFGLHNITEAFGIAAPLASRKVSWSRLFLLGLIAGGPNFVGTVVGFSFTSEPVSVLFLALAGGAIMYVIGELLASGRMLGSYLWNGWGLSTGFCIGLLTDFLLVGFGA